MYLSYNRRTVNSPGFPGHGHDPLLNFPSATVRE